MYSLGIDIGGTKCAVILGKELITDNLDDFIVDKIAFATETDKGVNFALNNIFAATDEILKRHQISGKDLVGIGISCGGPLSSKEGVIMSPPNLPGWDNIHIVKMFEDKYGVKPNLQNDANACAVAEWKFGAGRGCNNMAFLTFGTGMGAGLIIDGHLYSGTNDNAGEIGHVRMAEDGPVGFNKAGSFEGFCSGGGIARMAKKKASEMLAKGETNPLFANMDDVEKLTAKSLAIAIKEGNEFALSIYRKCGEMLGMGLSILIDVLNPECIVIGSIYERNQALFDQFIYPVIEKEAIPLSAQVCKIVPAVLGDKIGDYAALSLALS